MKDMIFYPIIGCMLGLSGFEIAHDLRPQQVSMSVKHLRYVDGNFEQWLEVEGGPVQADWAAQITRVADDGHERFLCVGGDRSLYNGEPSPRMSPSFWTGGECPEIQDGDRASASWEYQDTDGVIHRISASIVLKP
jgi:hypothetical protein